MLIILRFNLLLFTSFFICMLLYIPVSLSTTKYDLYANSTEKHIHKTKNKTEIPKKSLIIQQIPDNPKIIKVISPIPHDLRSNFICITAVAEDVSKCKSIKLFKKNEELGEIHGRYLVISTSGFKLGNEFRVEDTFKRRGQNKTVKLIFTSMNRNILINGKRSHEIFINTTLTLPNKLMNHINKRYLLFNTGLILLVIIIVILRYFLWKPSFHPDLIVPQYLWLYILMYYILPVFVVFLIFCNINYFLF